MNTFMVSKKGQVYKIVGEVNTEQGLTYQSKPVRSNRSGTGFDETGEEMELIHEKDVFLTDTNYVVIRNGVDKAIGII